MPWEQRWVVELVASDFGFLGCLREIRYLGSPCLLSAPECLPSTHSCSSFGESVHHLFSGLSPDSTGTSFKPTPLSYSPHKPLP